MNENGILFVLCSDCAFPMFFILHNQAVFREGSVCHAWSHGLLLSTAGGNGC